MNQGLRPESAVGRLLAHSVIAVFILTGLNIPVLFAEEAVTALSFAGAVETALKQNPDILAAKANVEGQKALRQKTAAPFMPSVDIYTDWIKGDAPSASLFTSIDKRTFDPTTDFNNPGDFENYESGIRARMQLFNGGKNILERRAAGDMVQASIAGANAMTNQVIAEVMKGWFRARSADRFVRISEETVATVRKQLEIMTVRYRGGSVLKSDILSLKVRLAEAEEELIRNRSRSSLAKASLALLLGISPETELAVIPEESLMKAFEKVVQDKREGVPERRPEIRQAEKKVQGAEKTAVITKRNYLPSVNLTGRYYLDDEKMDYETNRENWTVGVSMNWNLFSGMSGVADRKKAVADLAAAREFKRKAGLSVSLDIKRAYLMLDEAVARLDVSGKNLELAEESLELVRKQYEGGAATITRYLDAELAYSKARNRLATAKCDRMSAIAETARATGLLADPAVLLNAPAGRKASQPDETE